MLNQIISGYTLLRQIGEGGMGRVYYAENTMGQKAAVKVIHENLRSNHNDVQRLRREIDALVALESHPNIVSIKTAIFSTASPVIIMEYLNGEDLSSYIKRTQLPIDDPTLVVWASQILDALQHAHDKGIIHRDIKPNNLFLTIINTRRSIIKLLDFGIAKITSESKHASQEETHRDRLTKTSAMLGTDNFMSPEQQFDPKLVTHLTDIYSFGKTIEFLATAGGNPTIEPSDKWDPIIRKCTERNPNRRFQSCIEILEALNLPFSPPPIITPPLDDGFEFDDLSPEQQIQAYCDKYGSDIFDFIIDDDGHVRIQRYYDHPSRTHIQIPDFVYGFKCEAEDYWSRKAIFPVLQHVQSISLGKSIRDLSSMFFKSGSAQLDLSHWNTSNVTDMRAMFEQSKLSNVGELSHWNTSNVTNMRCMFSESQLTNVGELSLWNTSNVTDIAGMFQLAQLTDVGELSLWNTSNVTDMTSMFYQSQLINVGDLSLWNTSNVTEMGWMFYRSQLTNVGDLSRWNTSNVTNMQSMFYYSQLSNVGDLSQWNTSNVTFMGGVFECSQLANVGDLTQWSTSNVTSIGGMFEHSPLNFTTKQSGSIYKIIKQ